MNAERNLALAERMAKYFIVYQWFSFLRTMFIAEIRKKYSYEIKV